MQKPWSVLFRADLSLFTLPINGLVRKWCDTIVHTMELHPRNTYLSIWRGLSLLVLESAVVLPGFVWFRRGGGNLCQAVCYRSMSQCEKTCNNGVTSLFHWLIDSTCVSVGPEIFSRACVTWYCNKPCDNKKSMGTLSFDRKFVCCT